MRKTPRNALTMVAIMVCVAWTLSGCGVKGPTFVDRGTSYDKTSALAVLAAADGSAFAAKPTSTGVKLRHNALAALRREGAAASAVADLLTKTFPSTTTGVPIYVERATFGNQPAVLVVEATGPVSGTLNTKRLWVVSENGDILFAGSR
jgi:hypothetical protein